MGKSVEFHKYFRFRARQVASVHFDFKPGWRVMRGVSIPNTYVAKIVVGQGAGYIHGVTFFFARHSASARWNRQFRGSHHRLTPFGFEIGWTRNGNKVPYVSH